MRKLCCARPCLRPVARSFASRDSLRGCPYVSCEGEVQLPSLLARFQEINSPMVELVLDTGCL